MGLLALAQVFHGRFGIRAVCCPGNSASCSSAPLFPRAVGRRAVASRNAKGDPLLGSRTAFFHHPRGEDASRLDDRSRRSSDRALAAACWSGSAAPRRSRVRRVEGRSSGRWHRPLPEGVQAAAVEVLARDPACSRRRWSAPSTSPPADTASPRARRSSSPAGR